MYWNSTVPEINVSEFEESLQFYQQSLGFVVRYLRSNPNFAYLQLEDCQLMVESVHSRMWKTALLEKPFGRGINIQFEIRQFEDLLEKIEISKMTFFQNPQIVRYETGSKTETAVREFLIRDPDGYILRFVEKPFLPDSPVSVEGIDHFVLTVGNIKKTIAFYQSTLGMKPVEFKKGRWALLFGNQKINLHAADNIPDKNVKKATPGSADFCLTTWIPLERVIENLQQLSVPIIEGPGPRTGACEAIESIYICDPDENLVEICRPTLE